MPDVFVHERGLCESDEVGSGTRVWAFAHVARGARLGEDCNVCDGVFIEEGVVVGDRVTIKSGVQLWTGVTVEDDVFIGPNATFTNDPFPRSKQWLDEYPATIVRRGASIGANATILPGLEIGIGALVGAGAVVTRSVPPHAIVVGNPARIKGYAGLPDEPPTEPARADDGEPGSRRVGVGDVVLHRFPEHSDLRGKLTSGLFDLPGGIPFPVRRWFMVYDVPTREVRGEHAHRVCHQFLVCVNGSVTVAVDDGERRRDVVLDRPTLGLHLPPMTWATQYRYDREASLLVFASHEYDADDYIREYDEFLAAQSAAA
jgi:UDP-2-acetamido-3-amino-2,3-dideoxy-glucuronate N-acetyltransferase